ncbi:hypothetical protein LCGC14_1449040, partial [marine sediment metagenome]
LGGRIKSFIYLILNTLIIVFSFNNLEAQREAAERELTTIGDKRCHIALSPSNLLDIIVLNTNYRRKWGKKIYFYLFY